MNKSSSKLVLGVVLAVLIITAGAVAGQDERGGGNRKKMNRKMSKDRQCQECGHFRGHERMREGKHRRMGKDGIDRSLRAKGRFEGNDRPRKAKKHKTLKARKGNKGNNGNRPEMNCRKEGKHRKMKGKGNRFMRDGCGRGAKGFGMQDHRRDRRFKRRMHGEGGKKQMQNRRRDDRFQPSKKRRPPKARRMEKAGCMRQCCRMR